MPARRCVGTQSPALPHTCTMHCAHRYEHGLATVATFGKRCQLSAAALPRT